MNINSTSGSVSSLSSELFKSLDANSDGRLSRNEFQSFLETLVGQMSGKSGGLGTAATAASTDSTAAATAAPKVYQSMLGVDYVKLNTPDHTTPKYVFARATQDLSFQYDRASRSAGLQQIADYAKDHGYPDTSVVGDDCLDFGDGNGVIDVLTSDGQWWWGPKGV
jgi:hypothetical protein